MADWIKDPILTNVGSIINGWGWLSGKASATVISSATGVTRNRPHPWSTLSDYTSWDSLTDKTYSARQLPAATVPVQPSPAAVKQLFTRPAGSAGRLSNKSTCLFPAFAQYLTDGFIRTHPTDRKRTTTNHEIDLCPLYGLNRKQTNCLRLKSEDTGRKGRLQSQMIGNQEYSPFLYPNGSEVPDPKFADLDLPLFTPGGGPQIPPPRPARDTIFAVGGDRVNSTPFSAMMNTLFLREHNRIAGELEDQNPTWNDERVFQTARNIVIPIFIKIVLEDYINHITPLPFSLRADPSVAWDANWNRPNWITAEFSLLYRWHSLMPDAIQWPTGDIPLENFTLNNKPLLDVGLDQAFAAASAQKAGELGAFNTAPALIDIELFAVNQARHNRIDTYNRYRVEYGMDPVTEFEQISSDPAVRSLLEALYERPENVEFYPGLFAEDLVKDSPLPGLLLRMVAVDAFSQALTNPLLSEHIYNESTFTQWGLDLIKITSKLEDVLRRNSSTAALPPIEMTQAGWRYGADD